MKAYIVDFLRDCNIHFTANAGLASTITACFIHIAADMFAKGALHGPLAVQLAFADLDAYTAPLATAGALAAYLGRPSTVPSTVPVAASPVGADVLRPSRSTVTLLHVAGTAGGRSPMTFEGQLADAFVGYFDANKGALTTLLASKNVLVVDLVENAAAQLVAKNPMLSLIFGGEIKALAPQLTALLGTEEAAGIAALDALLHAEAAKLGG